MRDTLGRPITRLLIFAAVAGLLFSWVCGRVNPEPRMSYLLPGVMLPSGGAPTPEPFVMPWLEVSDLQVSCRGGHLVGAGTVYNDTPRSPAFVSVKVGCYDRHGFLLGYVYDQIEGLPKGEAWRFSVDAGRVPGTWRFGRVELTER